MTKKIGIFSYQEQGCILVLVVQFPGYDSLSKTVSLTSSNTLDPETISWASRARWSRGVLCGVCMPTNYGRQAVNVVGGWGTQPTWLWWDRPQLQNAWVGCSH